MHTVETKLATLDFLKVCNNVEKTVWKFKVNPATIGDWRKQSTQLTAMADGTSGTTKRARLAGGGRKMTSEVMEETLKL